jgi:hypothetical protein
MDDPRLTARQLELCLESLAEIENLLRSVPPGVPDLGSRIATLARGIEYHAPHGGIADLARKIRSEATDPDSHRMSTYLGHLKAELEAAKGAQ